MLPTSRVEAITSRTAIAASVVVFAGLLLALPAFYQSFDEAKYLGIGYQVLAGHGPRTLFGALFLPHSPLWSTVIAAPDVWFGVDAASWGHLLDGLSGIGFVLVIGALGWQLRPAIGALAAIGCLAVPYLHDLTRTARLDVPAATLALLYVWIGLLAVRRGSIRLGILAGAIFATGFLVKEIALPFAPIPSIIGLLEGRSLPRLARVSACDPARRRCGRRVVVRRVRRIHAPGVSPRDTRVDAHPARDRGGRVGHRGFARRAARRIAPDRRPRADRSAGATRAAARPRSASSPAGGRRSPGS